MTGTGRHLDWEGCHNVRDLGGLRGAGGRVTRRGAVVRSGGRSGTTASTSRPRLRAGGLTADQLSAVRDRLLEPAGPPRARP